MNQVTVYLKSPLGILKLTCLLAIALVVALSSYSHFNSHWVYHSRVVNREEVAVFNLSGRDRLTESRNEYEECRYNSRLYTGISLLDSPEKINGFGARQYDSTAEFTCPNPALELFLVATSISILIVSLISLLAISIWLPVMVAEAKSIRFYRILDMVLFGLAALFLFIGFVMFWYSTNNIWEWCSLKADMIAFTFKPNGRSGSSRSGTSAVSNSDGGSGGAGNVKRSVRLQHDDTVDIITGSDESYPVPVEAYQVPAENNQIPRSTYTGVSRNTILIPTAGPPAVLYLTRVKRESPNIELRFVESNKNTPNSRAASAPVSDFDIELHKIRQDQYMEICNMRQMTNEKYFAIAAALIAILLHLAVVVLIFLKCGKGAVRDGHDEEVHQRQHPNEDDHSNKSKRPKSRQESRPKSGEEEQPHKNNVHYESNVPNENYRSDANRNNDNSMDNRSSNERRTSYPDDEGAWQNQDGQENPSMQPHHHHHKPPGIDEASGRSHI